MVKHFCDRCGKPAPDAPARINFNPAVIDVLAPEAQARHALAAQRGFAREGGPVGVPLGEELCDACSTSYRAWRADTT